jgi:hypothetical protein
MSRERPICGTTTVEPSAAMTAYDPPGASAITRRSPYGAAPAIAVISPASLRAMTWSFSPAAAVTAAVKEPPTASVTLVIAAVVRFFTSTAVAWRTLFALPATSTPVAVLRTDRRDWSMSGAVAISTRASFESAAM